MNLYLITTSVEQDQYDTYDSAVVAAETEDGARWTHPGHPLCKHSDNEPNWVKPKDVNVKLIGEAAPGIEAGVICASFNPG